LKAEALPGFVFVGWTGSYESASNPAYLTVYKDHDIEAVFSSTIQTLYVDADAPDDPNATGTIKRPFDTIQQAIEEAADGDTILVQPGTYRENINLLGKNICLTGLDPNGTPLPIIDPNGTGPVVSFVNGEDPNCMLTGFVITGGRSETVGAIACLQSSPTIANCLITGNCATDLNGAAIYCVDSNAVFGNCTITGNIGGAQGAAMMLIDSSIALTNSIVWGNTPIEIMPVGVSVPLITYSDIASGWPDIGNIDTDPLFVREGCWLDMNDPDAAWVAGDYHLKSQVGRWDLTNEEWVGDEITSPCVDAGDPGMPVGAEPTPNGSIVNMGAYGGTLQASKSCEW
jgi:hypothetical protein